MARARKKTVLILDSNKLFGHLLEDRFASLGWKVTFISDSKKAEVKCKKESFDAILFHLSSQEGYHEWLTATECTKGLSSKHFLYADTLQPKKNFSDAIFAGIYFRSQISALELGRRMRDLLNT